ncbi:MAG: hypothetical protein ACKOB6_06360, partial [Candidatus Kapaibacterium sp.]
MNTRAGTACTSTVLLRLLVAFAITGCILQPPMRAQVTRDSGGTGVVATGDFMLPMSLHQASFTQLPGIPNCCTEFQSGFGVGFSLAAGVERKTLSSLFGVDVMTGAKLRVSLEQATMRERNPIGNIIIGSQVVPGIAEHVLRSTLVDVSVEPTLTLPRISGSAFSAIGAVRVGVRLSGTFEQYEQLVDAPAGTTFETGTVRRNEQSGAVPDLAILNAAVVLGARYAAGRWND